MFLLRAAFWLTAVAILMPREPDLGLGAPSTATDACAAYASLCRDGGQWLQDFRERTLISLARVRADLEAAKRD